MKRKLYQYQRNIDAGKNNNPCSETLQGESKEITKVKSLGSSLTLWLVRDTCENLLYPPSLAAPSPPKRLTQSTAVATTLDLGFRGPQGLL